MNQTSYGAHDCDGARKYLNSSENARFIEAANTLENRERAVCLTIYYTGCRPSELIKLTRMSLDQSSRALIIECAKKRGKRVMRRIPIPDFLFAELLALEPDSESGKIWNYSRFKVWTIIRKVMRKAGITGIQACPKGLRHGLGVRAAMKSLPLSQIQKILGHENATTTAIYLDVKDEEERDLIARTW